MKATIIILLLGFTFSFNPGNSMKYALTYCNHYNPKYHYYKDRGEDAHFVSQLQEVKILMDVMEEMEKV